MTPYGCSAALRRDAFNLSRPQLFHGASARGLAPGDAEKYGDTNMALALGYVQQRDNGEFEGTFSMGLRTRIRIVPNGTKESDKQPDFRIIAGNHGEIGGGWNKVGKASGKPYVSLTLAHPLMGPHKVYCNLGRAAGTEDDTLAILWNPKN